MSGFLSLCVLLLTQGQPPAHLWPEHQLVEQRINVHTHGRQTELTLAGDEDRLVAVWTSQRQEAGSSGVYGRVLDAALQPLGPEIHLNSQMIGRQEHPAVTMAHDGSFWVTWQSSGPGGWRIVWRHFDADLKPLGEEMAVETDPSGMATRPTVAVASSGTMLLTWQLQATDDEHPGGIRGRLFDATGQPLGDVLTLSGHGSANSPSTLSLDGERFVTVWTEAQGRRSRIHAASLAAGDGRIVHRAILHDDPEHPAVEPSAATLLDARGSAQLAISWMQSSDRGYDVWAQRFDSRLRPVADAFQVADHDGQRLGQGWQSGATVHGLPHGSLAILHNHDGLAGEDLWLHTFDHLDRRLAPPWRFNRFSEGDQRLWPASAAPRTLSLGDRQLVVAWQGASPGDGHGVHLTSLVPSQTVAQSTLSPRRHQRAAPPVDAVAPVPPIWRPDFRPSPRLEGLLGGADFGFEAIAETPWTPPDPDVAAGPDLLMFTTNGAVSVFDKSGSQLWVDEIEGAEGFWGAQGAGGLVFDPEVTWDPHAERYVVMANEDTNGLPYFLLAVSRDDHPDDAADWHKYRFEVSAFTTGSTFIDSPNLGLNRDFIFLTADFFGPDKYLLFVIDKTSVLEGGVAITAADLITGRQSMGIPVVRKTDTSALYIVESTEFNDNDTIVLHAITDPLTTFDRVEVPLTVPDYSFPIDPPQMGTAVRPELFEPRFWSVAQAGDSIWAVHHVDNARVRVRWYEFALNGWPDSVDAPTLVQSGEIDLGEGVHSFFPSIDADAQGNAAITFSRSATDEFISIWRAVRTPSMPLGTFGSAVMVQESANANVSGRWGDYSGTEADPAAPGTFWGVHQFTNGSTTSWRTWAARYDEATFFSDGFESGDTTSWSSAVP